MVFGVVVVPEPTMFGVGGSANPGYLVLAMSSPLLLIAASKLLNRGIQITESRHPNY